MLLWLAIAIAQEPSAPEDLPTADYEVTVTAERDVIEAREAVEQAVRDLGYAAPITLGRRSHHLHPKPWKGGVMIHEEGFARVHIPLLLPVGPPGQDPLPGLSQLDATKRLHEEDVPSTGARFLVTGRRFRQAHKAAIAQALEPLLREYRDAIARREQAWRLLELHASLDFAWESGIAPDGTAIGTRDARRSWLVDQWLHTADNADGAEVRTRISDFVRHRVQVSDHPFTAAELEAVDARAPFPDRLLDDG